MPNDLPTPQELAEEAERSLRLALDPHGTGAIDLQDGSRNTALVSLMTAMGTRVVRYAAEREAASRVSTATSDDLTTVGRDDYGEPRKEAAYATGAVRLLRPGSRPSTTIPQGTRFAAPATTTTPAVTFYVAAAIPVLTNETTVNVPLVAVETGEAGNLADPALVTQIVDALPDSTWAITTPDVGTVFGGGDSAENDEVYRARLLQLSTEDGNDDEKGTRLAVLGAILRTSGVRYAVVVEPGDGTVAAFVGDPNYVLTPAMRDAVATALLGWRCFGVVVDLRPFVVTSVDVVATVAMARPLVHYDTDAITTVAEDLVRRYFAARPHPDEYWLAQIQGAIGQAHPEVQVVTLISPAANVTRPPDSAYGALVALPRYHFRSLRLTFADPIVV